MREDKTSVFRNIGKFCLAAVIAVAMTMPLCAKNVEATSQASFPQHVSYLGSYLAPSVGQTEIDNQTEKFYEKWKKRYIVKDPYYKGAACRFVLYNQQHKMYKDTHSPVAVTVSEAQGYGMIITAIMAGYDKNAQVLFDSMYRYCKRFKSNQNAGTCLMAWQQWDNGKKIYSKKNNRDSASDGDIDIAYALLLADRQWGSDGRYNYRSAAVDIIQDIYRYEVNKTSYTVQYGDWVKWEKHSSRNYTGARSSDFILSEFRAFAKADSTHNWNRVISKTYAVIKSIRSRYSAKTGLLPDFIYRKKGKFYPEKAYSHESALDGSYGYNACRDPWRIGTDYLVSGSASARAETAVLNKWVRSRTGGDPSKIVAGYRLSGKKAAGYSDMCFTAPFLTSAVCKSGSSQKWVDALWNCVASAKTTNYYNDTIKMICMITAGGNWLTPAK